MKRFIVITTIIALALSLMAARPAAASTFTVNSTADAADANPGDGVCQTSTPGECTLRAAIMEANANLGVDTIGFDIPGPEPYTISPSSTFDFINDPIISDGTTQPGFSGTPIIELNGTHAGAGITGLTIIAGSSTVRGLVINRFQGNGMRMDTNSSNIVEGNYIGTDTLGTFPLANGSGGVGIFGGAANNLIGGTTVGTRNLISGNHDTGVNICCGGVTGNQVQGNFIGTNFTGSAALGNSGDGVVIVDDATNNTIGGTTPGARNVISGNGSDGIGLFNIGASGNSIQGNYSGTDVNGTLAVANSGKGVTIGGGAHNNTIGGTTSGAGNLISGNGSYGIVLIDDGTTGNLVQGNLIGTDMLGSISLANAASGVGIFSGAANNLIGGTTTGARNLISGNLDNGITICCSGATGNMVQGNFIGTDVTGTLALGNSTSGVSIDTATNNTIGGTTPAARNVISGNRGC